MEVRVHNGSVEEFFNVSAQVEARDELVVICRELYSGTDGFIHMIAEKYNCGAYGESVVIDEVTVYQSAMNGCWQRGHQREEAGDVKFARLFTNEARFNA